MHKKLTQGTISAHYKIVIYLLTFSLLNGCKKNPDATQSTESALMTKINAVQEQIMAQGNISKEEEQALLSLCSIVSTNDGLANVSPEQRMVLKDAGRAPVFGGCENLSDEETRVCFKAKVSAFITGEFNTTLLQDIEGNKPKQVDAFFIIDQTGNLNGIKVRDSELIIQGEILRILRKMPVMQPAVHEGANVSVLCSMIVKYGKDLDVEMVYIPELPED